MSDTNQEVKKIVFDDEQQKKINELVAEAQGRAAREAREELAREKAAAKASSDLLEETKRQLDALTKKRGKTEAEEEDVEALRANLAEQKRILDDNKAEIERLKTVVVAERDKTIHSLKNDLYDVRKHTALATAAAKIGFVDVDDVLQLTKNDVEFDEGRKTFIVKGEAGQPRLNNSLEPMTLDEFYKEYAHKKPFLVRADARGGTGSVETKAGSASSSVKIEDVFGPKSNVNVAAQLMRDDPERYRVLKAAWEKRQALGRSN